MPTISVIVPVYKVEPYLCCCVDSILAQTFTDFELILVDDGSPDRCGAMCDEYAAKDARVRVIHQENQGQAAARNHGVEIAKGEWISFVDSDDAVHPQMLEILYRGVTEYTVRFVCAQRRLFHNNEEVQQPLLFENNPTFDTYMVKDETTISTLHSIPIVYWVPWCKLIHVSVVRRFPFPVGRIYEDNAVVYRWLFACETVAIAPFEVYYYRLNQTGTMHSQFSLKRLDYLTALEEQIAFYRKKRYDHMVSKIGKDYMNVAVDCYRQIKNELRDNAIAERVRHRIIEVYMKNRRYIPLRLWEIELYADELQSSRIKRFYRKKKITSRFQRTKH